MPQPYQYWQKLSEIGYSCLPPRHSCREESRARLKIRAGRQRTWGKPRSTLLVPGIGPSAGNHLCARVKLHSLGAVHVQVAEQRFFPASKAVVGHGTGMGTLIADHASFDIELELAGGSAVRVKIAVPLP